MVDNGSFLRNRTWEENDLTD